MPTENTLVVVSDRYSYGEDNPPGTPIEMERVHAQRLIDSGMMRRYEEPKRTRALSAQTIKVAPKTAVRSSSKPQQETYAVVDINMASAKAIADGLKGIGDKLASAIVEAREAVGLFESDEDLLSVEGITQKMVDDNRNSIAYRLPADVLEPEE